MPRRRCTSRMAACGLARCRSCTHQRTLWRRKTSIMRGPAFSFAAEVERQIEQLSADDFHRRQGHSKVLLEEWYPISRLGIHLKQPGLEVEVEGFGDNGAADGRIEERGFRDRTFDIQVTFVDD